MILTNFSGDSGFGLSTILPDPTAFDGTNRAKTVLPGTRTYANLGLTTHYAAYPDPDQRIMFTSTLAPTKLDGNLDYSFLPDWSPLPGWEPGVISAQANFTQAEMAAFVGGSNPSELPGGQIPWLYRYTAGLGYTQPANENLTYAMALNYEQLSIHSGAFGGRVAPFDQRGNPLLVSPNGIDDMLLFRIVGLYQDLDDNNFPTDGTRMRFNLDQAIPIGSAQINMTRLSFNFVEFLPLHLLPVAGGIQTLVFNFQTGTILGKVPPYEAFNLGGNGSVRGFQSGDLGGGTSFVQGTTEIRCPVGTPTLFGTEVPMRLVTFVDYASVMGTQGQVFGKPGLVRDKPDGGLGYGVGFQAVAPVGLVRLETGWNTRGQAIINFTIGDRF